MGVLFIYAVDLLQTIPDAHLAILPDTTHMTIIKRTDLILPMIEDFIASAERGLSVSDERFTIIYDNNLMNEGH